ncbi:MAG: hypothetical protein WD492_07590 [Alkalispirochaeta sp.]
MTLSSFRVIQAGNVVTLFELAEKQHSVINARNYHGDRLLVLAIQNPERLPVLYGSEDFRELGFDFANGQYVFGAATKLTRTSIPQFDLMTRTAACAILFITDVMRVPDRRLEK